jgi:hypothetical protein
MYSQTLVRSVLRNAVQATTVLILVAGSAGMALAAPVTFNLNYTRVLGDGTAVGTFTVDDSLLAPGTTTTSLSQLLCFNLTITGIPGRDPFYFSQADLSSWILTIDASGTIENVNFYMDCRQNVPVLFGNGNLTQELISWGSCPPDLGLIHGRFVASPTRGGVCQGASAMIPTVSLPGLVALLLLVGTAAVLALKRGAIA